MEWKIFLTTLGTIFLAELGDKTQLAAILMTSKTGHPVIVFGGAVIAFSLVTLIGVVMRQGLVSMVPQRILGKGAALAFILIGLVMFFGKVVISSSKPLRGPPCFELKIMVSF